jgi:hypothetical protein
MRYCKCKCLMDIILKLVLVSCIKNSQLSIQILTHVLITYLLIVKFVENWLENLFAVYLASKE